MNGRYVITPSTSPDVAYPKPVADAIATYKAAREYHSQLVLNVRAAEKALADVKAAEDAALAEAIAAGSGAPKVSTKLPQLERDLEYAKGLELAQWQQVLTVADELKATYPEHRDEILDATLTYAESAIAEYDAFVSEALAGVQERFGRLSTASALLQTYNMHAKGGTVFQTSAVAPQLTIPRADVTSNIPQIVARLRRDAETKRGRSEETPHLPQSVDGAAE